MVILFILICCLAGAYFMVKKRPFDFFTIAFFSSVLYFTPAFFGFVTVPGFIGMVRPIEPLAYLAYFLVIALILLVTLLHDLKPASVGGIRDSNVLVERHSTMLGGEVTLYALATIAFVGFVVLGWSEIVAPGKPSYGREHAIFATLVPIAFACAVMMRRYRLACMFLMFLAVDVLAGNREAMVFAVGAGVIIRYFTERPVRALNNRKVILSGLALLFVLIVYKEIYYAFKSGNYELVAERLSSLDWYRMIVMRIEPFTTQAILTDSIRTDLSYSGPYFENLLYGLVPMAQVFGFDTRNNIGFFFDQVLYPHVDFGVARNIWAEGYVIGGWPLMSFYALLYALSPWAINSLYRNAGFLLRPIIAVSAVAFLFFIHRTGLEYNFTLQMRFWGMGLFALVLLPFLLPSRTIMLPEPHRAARSRHEPMSGSHLHGT